MVDRANLIKQLEPRVRPSGSQTEAIRKALDKALIELVLALPFHAVKELPHDVKSELANLIGMLDQKTCEKLSALWEPKRKLDVELKSRARKDVLDLILSKRPLYEPLSCDLGEARKLNRETTSTMLRGVAPIKDLKTLTKKWDKNWKAAQENRAVYADRLMALIGGAEPAAKAVRA